MVGAGAFRRWQLRWGATDAEVAAPLPGDGLLGRADRSATRAVSISRSPGEVWPWLAQMGQGRGGFYSYDVLENLIGCNVHSADRIVEEWQTVTPGDPFRLHPDIELSVAAVEPDHALVIRGAVAVGATPPPYDFTWAFVLDELPDGTTRLVVRERYAFTRRWAALIIEPTLAVSFVMTRRMLHGIRDRAQHAGRASAVAPPSAGLHVAQRGPRAPGVYLYWLPLGAGADVVRLSGRAFEAITSRMRHRPACDLYHSALVVVTDEGPFVIEMTPVSATDGHDRGVVAEGAVGSRWVRPLRVFRYEIHRWQGGEIADAACAVESPVPMSMDPGAARRVLELVSSVPTPVWGRDELRTGEMWNSNSVTSWLLARSGIDLDDTSPPGGGRAPGWDAGRTVARRAEGDGSGVSPIVDLVSA
jgi:hypothetical protein